MTPDLPTVQVELMPEYDALKLVWRAPVHRAEVKPAAQSLREILDEAREPLYILVELSGDVQLPTGVTISEVLRDVCRHPRLAGMLIYGEASSARIISRRLTLLTGQATVRAFDSEAEALNDLDSQKPPR